MRLKILSIISAVGLAWCLLVAPANAGSVNLGVYGNFTTFDTSGSEREGNSGNSNTDTETATTSFTKDVEFTSIFAEVSGKSGSLGGTLGIEYIPGAAEIGAKTRTDSSTGADSAAEADTGDRTAKAELSEHFTVYIEPTFYPMDDLGVYVKGGASRVTVRTLETLPNSKYGNVGVWGTVLGAGVKKTFGHAMLKLEYVTTDYDSITLDSTTGNKNRVTADPEQESIRLGIALTF